MVAGQCCTAKHVDEIAPLSLISLSYRTALAILDLPSLESRRAMLFVKWGEKLLKSTKYRNMLPLLELTVNLNI